MAQFRQWLWELRQPLQAQTQPLCVHPAVTTGDIVMILVESVIEVIGDDARVVAILAVVPAWASRAAHAWRLVLVYMSLSFSI